MKEFREWYKKFFNAKTRESMLRLLSHYCVVGGVVQVLVCTIFQIHGFAVYGIELVALGLGGKAYQEYNRRKHETPKRNSDSSTRDNDNSSTSNEGE